MAPSAQPQCPLSHAMQSPAAGQDSTSPKCPFSGATRPPQDSPHEPLMADPHSKMQPPPNPPPADVSPAKVGKVEDPSFLQRGQVSHVFDAADSLALAKMLIPWRAIFALGMLAASALSLLLPRVALLVVALALLLPPLAVTLLRQWRVLPNPDGRDVVKGAATDRMQGREFCVFLLGARNNAPVKLDQSFKQVGDAFVDIVKELERMPGSAGYLGGESYVGANVQRGSQVMVVTYWQSYEHLLRFTHNRAQPHVPAMKKFGKLYSMPDIGLWHEMYVVKPGQHESVYLNCPLLGLGAAGGLLPATGKLASSKGRVAASAFPPPPPAHADLACGATP